MKLFDLLVEVTRTAQIEDELPDYLVDSIFEIVDEQFKYSGLGDDISKLIEQIKLFDNYGQTGYIGMGVDCHILDSTLRRLKAKAAGRQ